eukprot:GHVT01065177.1.p1 GENE.GHVT01065177.1~~GHVT01065177.1.p1  ORF type:complete len:385 (-),score=97.46 GHVT01065177.1:302-1456(-)
MIAVAEELPSSRRHFTGNSLPSPSSSAGSFVPRGVAALDSRRGSVSRYCPPTSLEFSTRELTATAFPPSSCASHDGAIDTASSVCSLSSPPLPASSPSAASSTCSLVKFPFEYLDHPSEVILHSWGSSIASSLSHLCLCMFNLISDIRLVNEASVRRVSARGRDMADLIFHLLDECLFLYGSEYFLARSVEIKALDLQNLAATAAVRGEVFDSARHAQGTEVKAITMHQVQLIQTPRTQHARRRGAGEGPGDALELATEARPQKGNGTDCQQIHQPTQKETRSQGEIERPKRGLAGYEHQAAESGKTLRSRQRHEKLQEQKKGGEEEREEMEKERDLLGTDLQEKHEANRSNDQETMSAISSEKQKDEEAANDELVDVYVVVDI